MKVAGIVAEFNPFHGGHKYLIERTRAGGATHIAVVMSGSAVQRGEPAIADKHTRAAWALQNGADIVVELPAPLSCSNASVFARSAVEILVQLGIDLLAFGSENDDAALLTKAAEAAPLLKDHPDISRLTAEGMSYPAAYSRTAGKLFGSRVSSVLNDPNSTLAVEYISALKEFSPTAEILPIKRVGAAHDSFADSEFPSGSELRRRLLSRPETAGFAVARPKPAEKVVYYSLLTADRERLMQLPELGEPLCDRILKIAADPPPTLGEFLMAVKNKSCTLARLRRSALHLALGVTREDIAPPAYIRILAMNSRGREVLSRSRTDLPLGTSLAKLERAARAEDHSRALRQIELENRAVRLLQLCTGDFANEYRRRVTVE